MSSSLKLPKRPSLLICLIILSAPKPKIKLFFRTFKKLLKVFAEALQNLNLKKAFIVNSQDGLDEISPYANTDIVELSDGKIRESILNPKDLGINAISFDKTNLFKDII